MPINQTILTELAKPFHPSVVHWVPAEISNDKSTALATTEIDIKHYHNRLDKAAGMGWSVAYTPWGDRIVCHLTIDGVTRSNVGEDTGDQRAEVVAFKRACGMFGLGRYLDNMPVMWVPYDANSKTLEELSRARLHGIVTQHYQRFLNGELS